MSRSLRCERLCWKILGSSLGLRALHFLPSVSGTSVVAGENLNLFLQLSRDDKISFAFSSKNFSGRLADCLNTFCKDKQQRSFVSMNPRSVPSFTFNFYLYLLFPLVVVACETLRRRKANGELSDFSEKNGEVTHRFDFKKSSFAGWINQS